MGTLAALPDLLGDAGGPQFTEYGQTGFGPIGGYPSAPDLGAPTLPSVSVAPSSSGGNSSAFLQGFLHPFNTAQQLTQNATGTTLGGLLKFSLEDFIFIVLGLLLIAAGIFSFRQTQTIIREGGRAAVTAAAAAA